MHRVKAASILLTALLLLLIASVAIAQYAPDVLIVDQDMVDGEVTIARATVNGPGWVVVYADDGGEPGEVIGYAPLMNGINANIMVDLDPDALTDTLYAVIHEDAGFAGTFEFPGDDAPVVVDDEMVATPFQVTGSGNTIAGIISGEEGFGKLLAALQAAELLDSLRADGPFTLFAPTDEAFDALPEGELDELLKDTEALGEILRYHMATGQIAAADVVDGLEAETLQGMPLTFALDGDAVSVNDAAVTEADMGAVNGIIHAISSLLMPPSEEAAAEEEAEPETPQSIAGSYQESDGATVTVASVVAAEDGWVAIYADERFEPGSLLGHVAVPAGKNEAVVVELDEPLSEDTMVWAMLHVDDGKMGEFEYPDADASAAYNQATVRAPFNVAIVAAEAMADAEPAEPETAEASSGMAANVASFVQSFLTLGQDDPAQAAEEAATEEAEVADAASEEESAAEEAEEAEEEAEEEVADAESSDAAAETEESAAVEEVAAPEEASGVSAVASQVGSFVQSFLTLRQDEPAQAESSDEAAEEEAEEPMAEEPMDIVDTAIAAGTFQTLADALQAADLVDALKGEGPFTVFAPTDDAFAALPDGLLDELLQDSDKLTQVLLYHVVPDQLMADDISKMGSALTLEGEMLPFAVDGDSVMAGEAEVAEADIEAANGVIHAIGQVLLPPALAEAVAEPVAEEEPEPETPQSIAAGHQESDGSSIVVDSVISADDGWVTIRVDDSFIPGDVLGHAAVPAGESTDISIELDTPLTEDTMVWAVLHMDDGEAGAFEFPDADQPTMYNSAVVMGPFNVTVAGDEEMASEEEVAEEEVVEEEAPVEEEVTEAADPESGGSLDLTGMAEAAGAFVQNLLTLRGDGEEMAAEDDAAMTEDGGEEMAAEDDAAATEEGGEEMAAEEGSEEMAAEEGSEEMAAEEDAAMTEEGGEEEMAAEDDAMPVPDELPETGGSFTAGATTVPVVMVVLMALVAGAFVTRRRPV